MRSQLSDVAADSEMNSRETGRQQQGQPPPEEETDPSRAQQSSAIQENMGPLRTQAVGRKRSLPSCLAAAATSQEGADSEQRR